MIYIKLDDDKNLIITVNEPIYRGERLNQKLLFLLPKQLDEIDMQRAAIYMTYIRADGVADIALLKRLEEEYNEEYFQYQVPITCTLTRYPGEVCVFLQIYTGPPSCPVIAKSGECMLQINASTNMDDCITDRNLSLIYQMQRQMEEKIEKTEETLNDRIETEVAKKADNIVFDPENSTIQLVATTTVETENGEEEVRHALLGDPIFVRADNAAAIANIEINEAGELIITFEDDTTQNLGRVVGKDGAVYVPHVNERKILTFTVEESPTEIPAPVDLNPFDEWSDMDDEIHSDYVWEEM